MRWTARAWIVGALIAAPLLLAACGGRGEEDNAPPPAVAEHVKGTDITRVKLTAEAAKLIGLKTTAVRSDGPGTRLTVIPYAAVLYDPDGKTWTYTSPRPLVFQRIGIHVARIDGKSAILTKGPPVGTPVVTAGATEIWGVEYGEIQED